MRAPTIRRAAADDSGAVAVIVAIFVVVVVALSALVVDAGYYYNVKRQLQSAADAGALAGCQELINTDDAGGARGAATDYAMMNAVKPADGMRVVAVEVGGDYVRVTTAKTAPGFFGRALGVNTTDIRAVAKAVRVRLSGVCLLVPWAIPIVDEVDRVEAAVVTDGGAVVSSTDLGGDGTHYSGSVSAPGSAGAYYLRLRVYNTHGIYEGLIESQPNKEMFASRIVVVDDASEILDCSLSDNFLTASSPETPVSLDVRLKDPPPGGQLKVEIGKSTKAMYSVGGDEKHWRCEIDSGDLPVSNDLCVSVPVDVKGLGDRTCDAVLVLKRNSHIVKDADVSPTYVTPGGSINIDLDLLEYVEHRYDGTEYLLRVDSQAGAQGNYCELNFKTLQHTGACTPDPPGTYYGSNYGDWLLYGYGGDIHIGDLCSTSPGTSGSNTQRALDARFAGVAPEDRVVHVPVVEKIQDKGGTYDVEIVNFAAFCVTYYDGSGEVRGVFKDYVAVPGGMQPGGSPQHGVDAPRLVNP